MKFFLQRLKSRLAHPAVRGLDVDDPASNMIFSRIIRENGFLRRIYEQWYADLAGSLPPNVTGPVLELGSGAGFLERYVPRLITSEILAVPNVDMVMDGQRMPFADDSLRGVVMLDVLHHLPQVRLFFAEAGRCVKPGGVVAMIEPWCTVWGGLVYRYLHHEPFSPHAADWHFPVGGPLSAANSALPWIIFERDRQTFEKEFPCWEILRISRHTPFAYLLSGGLSMWPIVPERGFDACRRMEKLLGPWMQFLAMFATIVIRRKE
ncbi:MAG: class I SAM-dependent methyltransferase [Desulfosalsimonadaceae bacterium]|nr:class I SAM-dependent methyltransferase [Desulfosalsimonadaceae bacterium]